MMQTVAFIPGASDEPGDLRFDFAQGTPSIVEG
jgi:hypothetical protein